MDELVAKKLTNDLKNVLAKILSEDTDLIACREKLEASGCRVRTDLLVTFLARPGGNQIHAFTLPISNRKSYDLTTNDRKFLGSLKIGTDENQPEKVE
jgi:hypothetical protein